MPDSWKVSTKVLTYKNKVDKVDKSDLANWRPIYLQNTVYKIYVATIAKRIATWAITTNTINSAQKGFLPYEGCFEYNFMLQSCLRKRKKKVCVAWLDLKNAFGSVPTEHLIRSMNELSLGGTTISMVKDIYTNSCTKVKFRQGDVLDALFTKDEIILQLRRLQPCQHQVQIG